MDDTRWLAISNILLERRAGNLIERMLDGLPATHRFFVTASQKSFEVPGGVPGGTRGIITGAPRRFFPAGFPAIALYQLTLTGGLGSVSIAEGPTSVFFRRVIVPSGGFIYWFDDLQRPYQTARIEYKLEYLARLTGRSLVDVQSRFHSETIIQWRDANSLARQVEKRLDEQAAGLRQFVAEAKRQGMIDATQLRLEIQPTLTDLRPVKPALIPQPRPREIILDLRSLPGATAVPRTSTTPP
ncbi:MAG: hypothetical protein IPP47_24150 [Bryobacterales bacterium]|nr:hypothetical protein [Bryobacterales bacterium]